VVAAPSLQVIVGREWLGSMSMLVDDESTAVRSHRQVPKQEQHSGPDLRQVSLRACCQGGSPNKLFRRPHATSEYLNTAAEASQYRLHS
jgi:hypothetical protein